MTIDEAIIILEDYELNPCVSEDREAVDMAIKALEEQQNPNSIRINFVGEKEAEEFKEYLKNQQESVLDKIRAEIEAKCSITVGRENDPSITLHDVFEIIDKYKESEGKE